MLKLSLFCVLFYLGTSCVPSKKFYDLVEQDKKCQDELLIYKNSSISNENRIKEVEELNSTLSIQVDQLKKDTTFLSEKYQNLQIQYDRMVLHNINIEKSLENDKETRKKQTGILQNNLESKNLELQRKEDALIGLEKELKVKHNQLVDREKKVIELEEALIKKEEGIKSLKAKITAALRGFADKGFSIVERKGKIYISLDAKLLFKSGSTIVEEQGKKALIELAKVLEKEKDMEFIVEGHTDTDKLASLSHPKNNWELSALRATSIVEILLTNSKMLPEKIVAAGRSEYHPIDIKDKSKNRRIDIVIAPNLNALYQLIDKK